MPGILGFALFTVGPMIVSLVLSLTDYHSLSTPKFIGFDNYKHLLGGQDPFFYKSLKATGYYALLGVPSQLIFAFLIAMLLNRKLYLRGMFRAIFYMPTIVPAIATAMIWLWLVNPDFGLFNSVLDQLGLPTSKWIFSEKSVIPTLVFMSLWTTGTTMVIFLAGLQGVPRHLYEAIEIDGGKPIHKFLYVTLPMMTPTLFFNLVMAIINVNESPAFTAAFVMTNGGPNDSTLFMSFHLYREAFKFQRMGNASAIAWLLFLVIACLTFVLFKTSKNWVYYEGEGRSK
ncbi:carbohydrate ABC transporter permease [Paenibacillus albus]|uniref:Sugar ABC transporter permease n=1 Tax=Paenibacillus albus TaxID=2495582 RepID=A0A3Q8XA96_9BACL|nr:sugar ABC transporter permease [Paenibacillus albus]AZN43953.1 sugar ABC transporter permease [Paenibacillus albus]